MLKLVWAVFLYLLTPAFVLIITLITKIYVVSLWFITTDLTPPLSLSQIVTHNGKFHADDSLACWMLLQTKIGRNAGGGLILRAMKRIFYTPCSPLCRDCPHTWSCSHSTGWYCRRCWRRVWPWEVGVGLWLGLPCGSKKTSKIPHFIEDLSSPRYDHEGCIGSQYYVLHQWK
mgnify:CR=1 FL=1